jgi:hypothetical protein
MYPNVDFQPCWQTDNTKYISVWYYSNLSCVPLLELEHHQNFTYTSVYKRHIEKQDMEFPTMETKPLHMQNVSPKYPLSECMMWFS